jgi:apolipoprotein N-acyltransferase
VNAPEFSPKPPRARSLISAVLRQPHGLSSVSGLITGLSVPGIEIWWLAWFAPSLFLAAVMGGRGIWHATICGLCFGFFYSLVGMHWLLGLAPLDWLGFNYWQGLSLAAAAWVVTALHQSMFFAVFALSLKLLPLQAKLWPICEQEKWLACAPLTVPFLWVICQNKLGSLPVLLGVPWNMLEYSQYRQLWFIQAADTIGGIGLGFVLVMFNVFFALILMRLREDQSEKLTKSFGSFIYLAVLIPVFLALAIYGSSKLRSPCFSAQKPISVAVLQPNVNIEMQKTSYRCSLDELVSRAVEMIGEAQASLYIMPESALPTYLNANYKLSALLTSLAKSKKADIILGAIDRDSTGRLYNSAFAVNATGTSLNQAYHKRFLVPFGEYTPILGLPEWLLRLTNTPAGSGYSPGERPVIFQLSHGSVAPLICFEIISPELAAKSVKLGGELIANLSDLAWFHKSIVGEQMVACAVLRAVENRRSVVFAANSGPSAIVSPLGVVTEKTGKNVRDLLRGNVPLNSTISLFTCWGSQW